MIFMKIWFGDLEGDNTVIVGNSIDALVKWAGLFDSKDLNKNMDLEALAEKAGLCKSPDDYTLMLHETAMRVARDVLSNSLAGEDASIIQAVKALDDVNEAFNVTSERLVEWYGAYFPGQSMKPVILIDLILKRGTDEAPGAHTSNDDATAVKGLAAASKALFEERKSLEAYISIGMEALAPNLSKVLGPLLGARLIARAGGMDKLAKMPASTIQVMGAGDALFRHIRSGTPSPKHGLIYKHPLISGSPKAARGKISRMLAGKAAIAARVDYYSGEEIDLGDIKGKAAEIKRRSGTRKRT